MNTRALEIQLGGLGGQGVILAGMVIGRGLVLYEGKHVSLTQSFGPEARGSACSVQLLVSSEPVLYPYLTAPEILATLSQEAYRRFAPALRPGGILILEEDLVRPEPAPPAARIYRVPATRLAEELGRRLVMNMVLVGFFAAVTGLLGAETARRVIADSVPRGTESLNLAAFEKGWAAGRAQVESPAAVRS